MFYQRIWALNHERNIGIVKVIFSNLNKVIKNKKMSLVTKKGFLNYYVIYMLLYNSECQKMPSLRSLEARIIGLGRSTFICTVGVSKEVFRKQKEKISHNQNEPKYQTYITRKEYLQNLTITGHCEVKTDIGKQQASSLTSFNVGTLDGQYDRKYRHY